ncbi:cadmium-translocating P-type ATPase [Candidatus Kaiserbacteria bacterium RIFCSPHIGHO2_02_FULL_50_50]|uniref:Cadmium-translocating P-type ATPase n=1 Tax=Candidatus Kaiserbacteria bacterium RIFCSPHIGHO2_02_FULL_50_50 TaxID=1798492 RepID=A0A1F6DG40_9BACT|nr:MAG: cadmium-translocating P-type ATPase [Candidatus Kaiserbacteria bacterium RIFCSPHIGHO2_02_FULL_50_50]
MVRVFFLPAVVILLGFFGFVYHEPFFFASAGVIGVVKIVVDSIRNIRAKNYALDYIAFLALVVSLVAHEYLAGAVVALMFASGEALEAFAEGKATQSLRALLDRLPKNARVLHDDGTIEAQPLTQVVPGAHIMVLRNELVPLDGLLLSPKGIFNEANLTGESLPHTVSAQTFIKSGVVNVGETITLAVSGAFATSTYARIVDLVARAREDKAPFVRLSARANIPFTSIALLLATGAYFFTGGLTGALAVLVVATPCPLIIAAPVAFLGGISRAARSQIIVKRSVALEQLARAKTLFFDKTGTLTLGAPEVTEVRTFQGMTEHEALHIAAAIEFHSLHPLARAIVARYETIENHLTVATEVRETLGEGITGTVDGAVYTIAHAEDIQEQGSIVLALTSARGVHAYFIIADTIKEDARAVLCALVAKGFVLHMVTGDTYENAQKLFGSLPIQIHAGISPEEKYALIDGAKKNTETVVMIGDGLNDAPALARASVGMVFSGTENSAAIDAADVAIMGSDVASVAETLTLSRHTVRVATQSVWVGIGLSSLAMLVAFFGYIPPVTGALLQEGIDILVILNALRAAFKT